MDPWNDVTCPYCGHEFDHDNSEPFGQNDTWEEECPSCEKLFLLTGVYVETYIEKAAPCLNGDEPHDFQQPRELWPGHIRKIRCTKCGREKPK